MRKLENGLNDQANTLIFEINGGIGNQIFQLACSYIFAIKTGRRIIVDTRGCDSSESYHGSWHLESLVNQMQKDLPIKVVRSDTYIRIIQRKLRDWIHKPRVIPKAEIVHRYMLEIPFKRSEKYVYIPTIEDRFIAQEALHLGFAKYFLRLSVSLKTESYISSMQRVGVHIRRSDSITLNRFVPDSYFIKVLQSFKNKRIEFCCFTDSSEELNFLNELENVLIFGPEMNPLESLIRLSKCDVLVLSISTFSFWAAAISDSKQIIVPSTIEMSFLPLGSNVSFIDI
jgi:hypothetical protein